MKTRIISALFMLPLLAFIIWGGLPLLIITLVFSIIALYEFYKGFEAIDIHPKKTVGYLALILLYAIIVWGEFYTNDPKVYAHLICMWVAGTVVGGLLICIFKNSIQILDGIGTAWGVLYIALLVHIPLITRIAAYKNMIWFVFIAAFANDAGAYFIGCAFGKHKLCPEISPNKSVEGLFGGIVTSAIACGAVALFMYPNIWVHCVIIGLIGSCFGTCGDLVASAFKRKMGIKDYGNLIPGHGGIMDRFDSVLLVAPFVYYYILVVLRP